MSDDERIEQLELENKVLQENNKGLKAKIDELQKENEELKEDKEGLINGYKDTSDILNKRINCLFELLQQEGYLKFDNREQAIDYIDKLIKAEEENE